MEVYYVWNADGIFIGQIKAESTEDALYVSKMKTPCAWVQSEQAFIELHQIRDKLTLEHARNRQQLRFAEVKDSETRTWRDRKYAQ